MVLYVRYTLRMVWYCTCLHFSQTRRIKKNSSSEASSSLTSIVEPSEEHSKRECIQFILGRLFSGTITLYERNFNKTSIDHAATRRHRDLQ